MNEGLKLYAKEKIVASIHGYVYPLSINNSSTKYFIKGADCWGWPSGEGHGYFLKNGQS